MKRIVYPALLFLLLFASAANADWNLDSLYVHTKVNLSSQIRLIPLSSSYKVEKVSANITFFPENKGNQEVAGFRTFPKAEHSEGSIIFSWDNPKESELYLSAYSEVKKTNAFPQVKTKVPFPIKYIPEEFLQYIQPSETIDSDYSEITRAASKLAEGEDDLFVVVYKIADWTKNNVNYNLSTLTAEISQKASWVLENKEGVCDEIASLFIAMLRSLGVPAKFTSGFSYTDSELFSEKWGAHGWAEVYFPGYGWIPFDVTYGQYGFVDPTHIKFKDSVDPQESATYYSWISRDADIKTTPLDIKVEKTESSGLMDYGVEFNLSLEEAHISFGSYNLVEVEVKNKKDYYSAADVYLLKPKEVEIIGEQTKSILLLPNEKGRLYWILKVEKNLDEESVYTMPIVAVVRGVNSTASFKASTKGIDFLYDDANRLLEDKKEEDSKHYSANMSLECIAESYEFYSYENKSALCSLRNLGNVFLEKMIICVNSNCTPRDLGISQKVNLTFNLPSKEGKNVIAVSAKNDMATKNLHFSYNVLDKPEIKINEIDYPVNVSFDKRFNISFILERNSSSLPKNIKVLFSNNNAIFPENVGELESKKLIIIEFDGGTLKEGSNMLNLSVFYEDGNKKEYYSSIQIYMKLNELTLFQKLKSGILRTSAGIKKININFLVIMFAVSAAAFIIILSYVVGRSRKIRKKE